jgi:anti-anti-sigma factor
MSFLARIEEERHGETPVAAVVGEIDSSNVREIVARVHDLLTNRTETLVVDLARTSYIDSAGINMLFSLGDELAQHQQRLHLVVDPASPIARMLTITGLDATVATHATRDAAVAAGS